MPDTYSALYYHFIWTTKDRVEHIDSALEPTLYQFLTTKCRAMGVKIFAMDGMPDHVHLVCSVPPRLSLAGFMGTLKGTSSSFVRTLPGDKFIAWQAGYGVLSYSVRDMELVVNYVKNQKQHHAANKMWPTLENHGDLATP